MLVQIVLAREALAAHVALVHLLASVRHGMTYEMLLSAEGLRTGGANVRPLAGVQLAMLKQVLLSLERLAAHVAAEGTTDCLAALVFDHHLADLVHQRLLAVVAVQVVEIVKGLAAVVASVPSVRL